MLNLRMFQSLFALEVSLIPKKYLTHSVYKHCWLPLPFRHYGWLFVTPWTAAHQASPSVTVSRSLFKLMSFESVMSSSHLILSLPLLLLPSTFLSTRVFSTESTLRIRWPKHQIFSISPSNEYSGLISFRIDALISLQSKGFSRVF